MNDTFSEEELAALQQRRDDEAKSNKKAFAIKRNAAMDSFYALQDRSRKGRKRFGKFNKHADDGQPKLRLKSGKVVQTLKPSKRNKNRYTNYPALSDAGKQLNKAMIGWSLLIARVGATPEQIVALDKATAKHRSKPDVELPTVDDN
jgi:hypothetical protein